MQHAWPDYPILEVTSAAGPDQFCEGPGPYRPNVAALILRPSPTGPEILLGERLDTAGAWQWPQGGVDPGEQPLEALQREVWEEIGVRAVEPLYAIPLRIRYRFPLALAALYPPYVGQEQLYFVVRLPAGVCPDPERSGVPEFRQLRWSPLDSVVQTTIWFKTHLYVAVLEQLKQLDLVSLLGSPGGAISGNLPGAAVAEP